MRRWVVPVAVALLQAMSIRSGGGGDEAGGVVAAVGTLLGLAAGLLLVRRDTRPEQTAVLVLAAYAAQAACLGAILPIAPAVALHTVARRVPGWRGPVGAAAGSVVVAAAAAFGGGGVELTYAVGLLLIVLAGTVLAANRARAEAARQQGIVDERHRVARDLHDVVGHGMSAITVQAGAGRMALRAGQVAEAERSMEAIEMAGRDVLRQVRWLVSQLRESDQPALVDLPVLVDAARRCGLEVTCDVADGAEETDLPRQLVAYRVVQEALTNVVRHAGARGVDVTITVDRHGLRVLVADDGGTAAHPEVTGTDGHGLLGMRERLASMGGRLDAGPRADGCGWQVDAWLPAPAGRRR